jgi:WD40 repeat protein
MATICLARILPKSSLAIAALVLLPGITAMGAWDWHSSNEEQPQAAPPETQPKLDRFGDQLPAGVVTRIASGRMRHNDRLRAMLVSPDGKLLATGGGNRLRIWDTATGRLKRQFRIDSNWGQDLAFSADSSVLTSLDGYHDVTCRRFRLSDGEELSKFRMELDGDTDLSEDGSLLMVAGDDKIARLYDTATGRKTAEFKIEMDGRPALRPDGKALAVTDAKNKTMRIYQVPSGKLSLEFQTDLILFSSPAYSPDGRSLVACSGKRGGGIYIWDATTGKERARLEGSRDDHTELSFSHDGKFLAASGPQSPDFGVWDAATGKRIRLITPPTPSHRVRLLPDNKTLIAESRDGALLFWNVETGKTLPISADPITAIRDLRFDETGKRLFGNTDVFRAWDTASGREVGTFPAAKGLRALSLDARLLADSQEDGTIRLLDAATGKEIRTWKGHDRTLWVLFFSADGKRLYSTGGWDPRIRVWETATGRLLREMLAHPEGIQQMAASPDDRFLVTCGNSAAIASDLRLWNLDTGRELRRLPARPDIKHFPVFSPDSRVLAAATGRSGVSSKAREEVCVWEMSSSQLLCTLVGHEANVTALAFSPDSKTLATGSADRTVRLWDLVSRRERQRLIGHQGTILSLAFAPDGGRLAASSPDAPVFIWDVTTATRSEPAQTTISASKLDSLWQDLGNKEPAKALRAAQELRVSPVQAVELIRKTLKPAKPADAEQIRKLLGDLDSEEFSVRSQATRELRGLGDLAGPGMRKALEGDPSPEARRRIEELIDKLSTSEVSDEALRAVRSIALLEAIGTPKAREVLKASAKGAPEARLTREAKAALQRLERR